MLDCLTEDSDTALPLYAVSPSGLAALSARLPAAAAAFLRAGGFTAKAQEWRLLPGPDGLAGAVLGLGEDSAAARSPWAFGALPFALPEDSAWRIEDAPDPDAATLGWCLGAYRFNGLKSVAPRRPARLVAPPGSAAGQQQAAAIRAGRDLINQPANLLGPQQLAEAVGRLAAAHGAEFETVSGDALEQGFPAIAAVGRGSVRPPHVAMLRWQGAEDAPLVVLCGKGVCFDTGGLDLKPSAGMLRMKKDMGGAAAMIATAEMLMRAAAPIRLLLLVGAVENSVSGDAFRPLDVIRTRKGTSVEIGNTDAEGRLVLADLLTYAVEQKPSLVVDAATLTGAARVALGPDLPALFSNDDSLAHSILSAGQLHDDPLWQMPLEKRYNSWLDSSVADMNNVSTRPMAGAIVAALFLSHFVPNDLNWAHIDLYAWNDQLRPGRPEGGEIQAARSLAAAIVARITGPTTP